MTTATERTESTHTDFRKVVRLGTSKTHNGRDYSIYCEIKYKEGRLSISGVEGPLPSGNCYGACGQIDMHLRDQQDTITLAPGWTSDKLREFFKVWQHWHLNDMRAGCEHQRTTWNNNEKLEVVHYGLTSEALRIRREAIERASVIAASGADNDLNELERALILLKDWFKDRPQPPDADSPLSGCYEVKKRETKTANWVYPSEHSRGLLMKPCETCGYKYGSAWLREEVPQHVLDFLKSLPTTDMQPAWV